MTEVAIIAIVVCVLAIIIGKANRSNELILRLLFCFSVSMCVSIAFLHVFDAKPKAKAQTVEMTNKTTISDSLSHTVYFTPMVKDEVSLMDTVGKDNLEDSCLIKTRVSTNMFRIPKGKLAEHTIYDSS